MKILDNINHTVREDLQDTMQKGSRVSIAAACFSIYAYQELKKQLEEIAELRFIFTSPTFVQENTPKERREFYIPKLTREKSLYGTEFEVRLRNELTQKALAKECADWVRRKVKFRSNVSGEQMPGFMTVGESSYMPISGFTTVDLGCERGNNAYYPVQRTEAFENGRYFLSLFDEIWNDSSRLQDVTDIVLQSISTAYRENSPDFIYFFTLYNIFSEFLEDVSEDNLPNEATGFKQSKIWNMLYDFQRDAALAIIHKLEQYNGCILADSVGLGKTFTALAVIKYYENRNKSVLVLCPKKLAANWNIYKGNYVNNPLVEDRFRYDVLYHTDLSRSGGTSNGIDLAALNWGNFDLVVIDESHNFRNGSNTSTDEKENRYTKLMNRVIRSGVRTKVLMLSATPVNNRFVDLKNQLALAYEGDAGKINEKLNTSSPIDEIFRQAQKAFNTWSKLPVTERTTNALLAALDFDFFEVLDSVTIARSRQHIEKYYNISDVGTFPERLKPISVQPCLTSLDNAINYQQIYNVLDSLTLHIYTPTSFILSSRISKYIDPSQHGKGLTQAGREEGIRRLMSINLLKRLKNEVVDLEEMSGGISIMDLGLNEFRLDLLDYMKKHDDVEHTPLGMHAIVASTPDAPPGVIFVLKNINNEINVDQQNRLHPFYMVYIGQDGSTVCDYLSPKELLDRLRLLCKGKTEPDQSLCQQFNQATDDGKNMSAYSELLSEAIRSILDAKEESDIDSLFKMGGTTALLSSISGLDDFELICFLVVQ
jgi:hypothetical protein